jgi:hypothetical protein
MWLKEIIPDPLLNALSQTRHQEVIEIVGGQSEDQDHGDHHDLGTDKLKRNIGDREIDALDRDRGAAFENRIDLIHHNTDENHRQNPRKSRKDDAENRHPEFKRIILRRIIH